MESAKKIFSGRIRRLRRRIASEGLDGLIILDPCNVTYLSGFLGHDSWFWVSRHRTALLTDSRYIEQARKECPCCRIVLRKTTLADTVSELIGRNRDIRRVGIESSTSVETFAVLKKKLSVRISAVGGLVEPIRQIKNSGEIQYLRRAARGAWQALSVVIPSIRPGISESEIAGLLEYEIRRLGMRSSFEPIVCFGPNGSRNHHQPSLRRLRIRDTILIDFGARLAGYGSDLTRSFAIGKPTTRYRRAWQAVYAAQQKAIDMIRPGADTQKIDAAIRTVIQESGFPVFGHGSGHGIGLAVHEGPFLSPTRTGTLSAGQVITIEPGIYLPGIFGIRIEDDIHVTESGREILSQDDRFGFSDGTLMVLPSA